MENLTFQKVSMHLYLSPEKKAARKEWDEKMYIKMSVSENGNIDVLLSKTSDNTNLPWFTTEEDTKQEDWYIID